MDSNELRCEKCISIFLRMVFFPNFMPHWIGKTLWQKTLKHVHIQSIIIMCTLLFCNRLIFKLFIQKISFHHTYTNIFFITTKKRNIARILNFLQKRTTNFEFPLPIVNSNYLCHTNYWLQCYFAYWMIETYHYAYFRYKPSH